MKVPVPVYGAVPPLAVTVTVVVPVVQLTTPFCVEEATNCVGSLTLPDTVLLHPLASVTV